MSHSELWHDTRTWRVLLAEGLREASPAESLKAIEVQSRELLLQLVAARVLESRGMASEAIPGAVSELWERACAGLSTTREPTRWDEAQVPGRPVTVVIEGLREVGDDPAGAADRRRDSHKRVWREGRTREPAGLGSEVLGRVYEQLAVQRLVEAADGLEVRSDERARQRDGIYYTPRAVATYLASRTLGPRVTPLVDEAIAQIRSGDRAAAEACIDEVFSSAVLDPACGAGRCLLEAFELVASELRRYRAAARRAGVVSGAAVSRRRDRIAAEMLFGVDTDPEALAVAKLSLWTRLADEPSSRFDPAAGWRLPPLALNLRHGNSLLALGDLQTSSFSDELRRLAERVETARTAGSSEEERRAAEALRTRLLEREVVPEIAPPIEDSETRGWQRPVQHEIAFPTVFRGAEPGFDVVLGNPPYFNVDATFGRDSAEAAWLAERFPAIYTDKTDILFYFIARAHELLADGGTQAFILSRAFLSARKALRLRTFLADETDLREIVDFLGHEVFGADVAAALLRADRRPPAGPLTYTAVRDPEPVRDRLAAGRSLESLDSGAVQTERVDQTQLQPQRWTFGPFRAVHEAIDADHPTLAELDVELGKGMETGRNSVFRMDAPPDEAESPEAYLAVRLRNSEIEPFAARGTRRYLYLEDREWSELPAWLREYLREHESELRSRAALERGDDIAWFKYAWPLHRDRHFATKIVCPYRADANRFCLDPAGRYLGLTDTTHVFFDDSSIDPHYACALLNSSVLQFRYRALGGIGKLTGRGMFEYFAHQIGELPMPAYDAADTRHAELRRLGARAHRLASRSSEPDERLASVQREIDRHALELYGVADRVDEIERGLELVG